MDPFAPTDRPPVGLYTADLVADALRIVVRNLGSVLLAVLLLGGMYALGLFTCVGWIVLVPAMFWGGYRYFLALADGEARVASVWEDLPDVGRLLGWTWGWMLMLFTVSLPVFGVVGALAFAQQSHLVNVYVGTGVNVLLSTLWSLVIVRVAPAPFLMVDRQIGPIDATVQAMALTGPVWGTLVYVQLLIALLGLPAQVIGVGIQKLAEHTQADPSSALQDFGWLMVLYLLLVGIGTVASIGTMALYAVIYRRLVPRITA